MFNAEDRKTHKQVARPPSDETAHSPGHTGIPLPGLLLAPFLQKTENRASVYSQVLNFCSLGIFGGEIGIGKDIRTPAAPTNINCACPFRASGFFQSTKVTLRNPVYSTPPLLRALRRNYSHGPLDPTRPPRNQNSQLTTLASFFFIQEFGTIFLLHFVSASVTLISTRNGSISEIPRINKRYHCIIITTHIFIIFLINIHPPTRRKKKQRSQK